MEKWKRFKSEHDIKVLVYETIKRGEECRECGGRGKGTSLYRMPFYLERVG